MFDVYPVDERWRVILCGVCSRRCSVPSCMPRVPYKELNAILFFVVLPIVAFFLLVGGHFGLRYVATRDWGGFMVTLVLSYVGIVVSLPLGVVLALGRRSKHAGGQAALRHLHRGGARRAADHRAVHGDRDAAAVPAATA